MTKRKIRKHATIEGPTEAARTCRKTFYLSEVAAFNLDAVVAMSSLNGNEWNGSTVVSDALDMWFEKNGFPKDRFMKLTMK